MANKKIAATAVASMTAAAETTAVAEAAPKKTLSNRAKELFATMQFDAADRGKAFRKTILTTLMAEFPGTTIASAAGAYNNAKAAAQKAEPEKYADLGREPGKNNGGPKKRVSETETASETAAA